MQIVHKALWVLAILFPLTISAQYDSTKAFIKKSKEAEDITDSIAAVFIYRLKGPQDSILYKETIQKVLEETYPQWYAAELFFKKQKFNQAVEAYNSIIKNNAPSLLKRYAGFQKRILQYEIDPAFTASDASNDIETLSKKEYVLEKSNELMEWSILKKRDTMLYTLKEMSEKIPEDVYPHLQLFCTAVTLAHFFGQFPNEGIPLVERGIRISESIPEYFWRYNLYNLQSLYEKNNNNYGKGIEAGQNRSKMAILMNDSSKLAFSYLNLSVFQQEQGRFEEAYKEINNAREIVYKLKDTTGIAQTYGAEGFSKMNENKYEEAISLLKKGLQFKSHLTKYNTSLFYLNIIDSYYSVNKLDSVSHYYDKLVATDPEDRSGFHNIGKTFLAQYLVEQGDYKRAKEYISISLADAEAYQDLNAKSIALLAQSKLYTAEGKHKKALEVFKVHHNLEQDFRNEEKAAEVTAAQLNSEFDQQKKITELRNEKEKLVISNQRNRAIALGTLGLLFAISAVLLYLFTKRKNKEINEKNVKLQELNNVKDTLFQIIGHDLKKPTLSFRNISNNINYLIDKKDFKRLAALGNELDQDAKSLYNLTDNLLNWALVQKEMIRINKEKINIHELVQDNINLLEPFASRKHITLNNDTTKDALAYIDKNSFDTIVRNLIDNAIKYTNENGTINISSKGITGFTQVIISDNGIGISEKLQEIINKNRVIKSQDGTDGEKGSGIGLQVIKHLADKNQVTVSIDSDRGKGSIFTLNIPIAS